MKTLGNFLALACEVVREFLPGRRFRQPFGPLVSPGLQAVLVARMHTPVRFCPHCGAAPMIPAAAWRRIEANDKEITCPGCFRVPRLWMREPVA